MFCREQSIQASGPFGAVAAPIKCRSWLCPLCAPMRQRQLQARGIEGKPNRFITLTCRRGQFSSPEAAAQALVESWRTIVRLWRRKEKWHKCEYLCVFEPHKSGWPHLHILWKGHYISQAWLSEQMTRLMNSPVQSVMRIKGAKQAVAYVTKYFTKAPARFGKLKRYWTSGNWPRLKHTDAEPVFRKGFPIERLNQKIEEIQKEWQRHNKPIYKLPPDIIGWGALYNPLDYRQQTENRQYRIRGGLPRWKVKEKWSEPADTTSIKNKQPTRSPAPTSGAGEALCL